MNAQIVSIGEELLLGSTINTNASWLGDWLDRLGCPATKVTTIGDDLEAIKATVSKAMSESDVVVVTGGLGPTHDDITKHAIAEALGVDLVLDPEVEEELRQRFERRGRPFSPDRRSMAFLPQGFTALLNPVGTAPGLLFRQSHPATSVLLVMPGVPYEMKSIAEFHFETILSHLPRATGWKHRTFLTAGITENLLESLVQDLIDHRDSRVRFALLPDAKTGVRLRVSVNTEGTENIQEDQARIEASVMDRIGVHVYGYDTDVLEEVVGAILKDQGLTLAAAESCTGGLISDRLTDVPGSSVYFRGAIVAYENVAKEKVLGVSEESLRKHGAVSKQVAMELAEGCRRVFRTDIGISATGIAGPGGGTEDKPVGTVCLGLSTADQLFGIKLRLTENRRLNKLLTSTSALNLIRKAMLGIPLE